MRVLVRALVCLAALLLAQAADAQTRKGARAPKADEVRIGVGHGIGFLPLYLAQDMKLFDKHAAGRLRVSLQRFGSAAPLREALARGEISAGAFGLAAFLRARDGHVDTPQEMVAISGVTTLPLTLVSARADVNALSDLKPDDRIAVPMLGAPQMTCLQMQAEKWFAAGTWERLRRQVVAMPHQDALDALAGGKAGVAAYFASPPFTQMALKERKAHAVLSSVEVMGGKTSFLVMAAARERLAAHPQLAEIVARAVDDAAAAIRKDPRAAALTYLKYEPSHRLDARMIEAVLRELKDDFGSGVFGVDAVATFLRRDGRLKNVPWSWKNVVAPVLAAGQGS
jgi:NitT/TauT family transport system substrate-binding protein